MDRERWERRNRNSGSGYWKFASSWKSFRSVGRCRRVINIVKCSQYFL
jgi:hypothetical protein